MQHEDYDKGSLNDMKVSRDEESNKQHIHEEQQLLDEIMAYEEECSDKELGKKNIPDVEDLLERLIRVDDLLSSKRKKEPPIEIQELVVMLPTYLSDNVFYDKTERTDWSSLEADCGVFVCAYVEILSEGLQVHSCVFDATSQRARYSSLLWHYGVKKANEGYTSDNGDPPRPRKSVIEEIYASAIVTLE
ncbi:hypothetical protein T459_23518 [Capsicum annuum]|uniref:Ubiquitin-like protease family profile domain-containing protein n=1 Tax=Capsicum annuum TaxID=4072 RepID=A0A2G2YSM3_CAPAN|nr:hypothetical protein T459_23518 [Capsicum annuum]